MKKQPTSNSTIDKIRKEKETLLLMIRIYCKGHRHAEHGLCADCQNLLEYAYNRVDLCPFIKTKTFCKNCKVHCYKADMRDKIRKVMRYSGPRMIFYNPVMLFRHAIDNFKQK